ncbi:MAG TPA: hypothetical protein VJJ55_02290 [Candidatus Paceibacterota bacterium]
MLLELIPKPAFKPRNAIFKARRELEGEKYGYILSPKRSVVAKNCVSQSRNEVWG